MEYDKQLFIVTPKKKTALKPGAVRAAVPDRFEVARVGLAITGTVKLLKDQLVFEESDSKFTFLVALKKVGDEAQQKRLQKAHNDLVKAVKIGPAKVRLRGEFADTKDAPLSLDSFKKIKSDRSGLLSVTIEVKGLT